MARARIVRLGLSHRLLWSWMSCDLTLCGLVDVYWCSGCTYCLHLQGRRVNLTSEKVFARQPLETTEERRFLCGLCRDVISLYVEQTYQLSGLIVKYCFRVCRNLGLACPVTWAFLMWDNPLLCGPGSKKMGTPCIPACRIRLLAEAARMLQCVGTGVERGRQEPKAKRSYQEVTVGWLIYGDNL